MAAAQRPPPPATKEKAHCSKAAAGAKAGAKVDSSRKWRRVAQRHGDDEDDDIDPVEYELVRHVAPRFGPPTRYDVFITRKTDIGAQVKRCAKLLSRCATSGDDLRLHALGRATDRAINVALRLCAESGGALQCDATTSTVPVTDELVPLVDDARNYVRQRCLSALHIRLFVPKQ